VTTPRRSFITYVGDSVTIIGGKHRGKNGMVASESRKGSGAHVYSISLPGGVRARLTADDFVNNSEALEQQEGWRHGRKPRSKAVTNRREHMASRKRHSKKRSSKSGKSVRRNRGHHRLRRNPDTMTWLLLAGGGYLAYRWWQGRQHAMPVMLPSAPPPVVATPVPPPAVSGLGSLVVM